MSKSIAAWVDVCPGGPRVRDLSQKSIASAVDV